MSVLKYLSAGRSLVGLKDTDVRYRMGAPGALPKFDSKRNPFRSRTVPGSTNAVNAAPQPEVVAQSEIQAPTVTLVASDPTPVVPVEKPAAAPVAKVEAMPLATNVSAAFRSMRGQAIRISTGCVRKLGDFGGAAFHGVKSLVWWRRTPKPQVPRLAKAPVQGELSLDAVKVVRNDLTDADFEVVPRGRKTTLGTGENKKAVTARAPELIAPAGMAPAVEQSESETLVEAGRER